MHDCIICKRIDSEFMKQVIKNIFMQALSTEFLMIYMFIWYLKCFNRRTGVCLLCLNFCIKDILHVHIIELSPIYVAQAVDYIRNYVIVRIRPEDRNYPIDRWYSYVVLF